MNSQHRIEIINRNPTAESTGIGLLIIFALAVLAYCGAFSDMLPSWTFWRFHGETPLTAGVAEMVDGRLRAVTPSENAPESGVFTFTLLAMLWKLAGLLGTAATLALSGIWWAIWAAGFVIRDVLTGTSKFWESRNSQKEAGKNAANVALASVTAAINADTSEPQVVASVPVAAPFTSEQLDFLKSSVAGKSGVKDAFKKHSAKFTEHAELLAGVEVDVENVRNQIATIREELDVVKNAAVKPRTTTRRTAGAKK